MRYVGAELELFRHAQNWKNYYRSILAPYLRGDVLEVGAGIGSTTRVLCHQGLRTWTALEPDSDLIQQLQLEFASHPLPCAVQVFAGTLRHLPATRRFDAILYIDVLEHIEDDRTELMDAATRLADNGALIILAPAHQWLFSEFDSGVGHFRRYSAASLEAVVPRGMRCEKLWYLDSVGLLASLGNRRLLHRRLPTGTQLAFWDRRLVPLSRYVDKLSGYLLGRSVLGIWRA